MTRYIMAEIVCDCGKLINVRLKENKRGDYKEVPCWKCKSVVRLKGTQGYVNGKKATRTTIVSDEIF